MSFKKVSIRTYMAEIAHIFHIDNLITIDVIFLEFLLYDIVYVNMRDNNNRGFLWDDTKDQYEVIYNALIRNDRLPHEHTEKVLHIIYVNNHGVLI